MHLISSLVRKIRDWIYSKKKRKRKKDRKKKARLTSAKATF